MRHRHDRHSSSVFSAASATPLVDMIFTLSMFYMLVAEFHAVEQVPMNLPRPQSSQAAVARIPERIVINCHTADPDGTTGASVRYSIGPNLPESLGAISDRLAAARLQSPELNVVVRADRRLRYGDVRAVMRVAARNRIEVLNVAAQVGGKD